MPSPKSLRLSGPREQCPLLHQNSHDPAPLCSSEMAPGGAVPWKRVQLGSTSLSVLAPLPGFCAVFQDTAAV